MPNTFFFLIELKILWVGFLKLDYIYIYQKWYCDIRGLMENCTLIPMLTVSYLFMVVGIFLSFPLSTLSLLTIYSLCSVFLTLLTPLFENLVLMCWYLGRLTSCNSISTLMQGLRNPWTTVQEFKCRLSRSLDLHWSEKQKSTL